MSTQAWKCVVCKKGVRLRGQWTLGWQHGAGFQLYARTPAGMKPVAACHGSCWHELDGLRVEPPKGRAR